MRKSSFRASYSEDGGFRIPIRFRRSVRRVFSVQLPSFFFISARSCFCDSLCVSSLSFFRISSRVNARMILFVCCMVSPSFLLFDPRVRAASTEAVKTAQRHQRLRQTTASTITFPFTVIVLIPGFFFLLKLKLRRYPFSR